MSRGASFGIAASLTALVFAEGLALTMGVDMSATELWLTLFILGVVVFMVGVLVPHRLLTMLGAVAAAVGGIGWFIQSLT